MAYIKSKYATRRKIQDKKEYIIYKVTDKSGLDNSVFWVVNIKDLKEDQYIFSCSINYCKDYKYYWCPSLVGNFNTIKDLFEELLKKDLKQC